MIRILTLLFTASLASSAFSQSPDSPIVYPVSPIAEDAEQIARVHKAVVLQMFEAHKRKIESSTFKIRIIQRVPERGYICSVGDRTVLLETKDTRFADGDETTAALEATGEKFEYTSVLGAGKTLHVMRQLSDPKFPTLAQFIEQLKGGARFLITKGTRKIRCEDCGGFGKGRMIDGRYIPCSCRDVGIWTKPNYYEVVW